MVAEPDYVDVDSQATKVFDIIITANNIPTLSLGVDGLNLAYVKVGSTYKTMILEQLFVDSD